MSEDEGGGPARRVGQVLLGAFLVAAGVLHLTTARQTFQAQVPPWLPLDPDLVVVGSGLVEIAVGLALLLTWRQPARSVVGWATAALFVAVLPGNITQLVEQRDAFGLDTDLERAARLPFQIPLIVWALWSTSAWRRWRAERG